VSGPSVPWEERRLSFGEAAAEYDRWRPGYPAPAVRWILGDAPARVADLGAGTGRLARAAADLGHEVVAVEPDPGMRVVAEAALRGARVLDGSAEAIPLADASVDAVLAGQAWHWFAPERAVPEIARVLRPGGVLGVLWNVRDEREPWLATLAELVDAQDRSPGGGDLPTVDPGPPFGAPESREFPHAQELRAADLPHLVDTYSWVRRRPDREAVLASVAALAREHPDLRGRETLAVPYRCHAVRARRG
jgi:SAM-dependent methyltransferase